MARAAINDLGSDELLWMVTPDPPHKTDARKTNFEHRYAMSQLCVTGETGIVVSDFENQRPGPHYTSDTIDLLRTAHPERVFSLLIGGDSLRNLHTWHEPHRILSSIEFLGVFARSDPEQELAVFERNFPDFTPKLAWIIADPIALSSSQIRVAIANGEDLSEFLPSSVWEYIQAHGLYKDDQDVIAAAR